MDCSELVMVVLPSALKAIPRGTFAGCEKLADDTAINDDVKTSLDAFCRHAARQEVWSSRGLQVRSAV